MSKPKTHYWRFRDGRYLIPCGASFALMRKDGTFNCKRCLKVVSGKSWSYMINAGYAKTKFVDKPLD